MNLYLLDSSSFCTTTQSIWSLVGKVITAFKIIIPILIIVFGMLDLGKAVVASDDKEIKTAGKRLLFRVLAGVIIFILPNLIVAVIQFLVPDDTPAESCLDSMGLTSSK